MTEPSDTKVKDEASSAVAEEKKPTLSFSSLFQYADGFDYLLMVIGSIGAIGNGACWPVFAILFAKFTDTFGSPDKSDFKDNVATMSTYFVYLGLGSLVCSYFQAAFWMWTGNRQTNRIRGKYLKAVLRQDVPFFDAHSTTGGLLAGLSEDSVTIQQATSEKVGHFLQHSSTFIVGFAVAFWRGWDMALVMLGCLPFLAVIGGVMAKITTTFTAKGQKAYNDANSTAIEAIGQIRTVNAYNQQERHIEEYDSKLEIPFVVGMRQGWANGLSLGSVHAVVFVTYAIALYYGAWRCANKRFGYYYTGGDVLNVMVSALLGGFSLGQAAPVLTAFSKGRVAGERVFEVIHRKPDIDIDADGEKLSTVRGEIELKDVTFYYPARPDLRILKGMSLVVPAGKTVALVGSSGSGKSTVVQMIERFYDPASGSVFLDGVDLKKLHLGWLRSQVGLVSQEPTLFATSIYENIKMGKPDASMEEVEAAAQAANAHSFIAKLPHKYDTHVGERGLQLSGGQKQRIAIARAILKNPKVLLLDEATSALDTESERVVQDALDRMVVGRTTVVVAHRLSTIQGADIITVVQSGEIVEQGDHHSLLQKEHGAYAILVKVQMQAAAQAEGGDTDTAVKAFKGVDDITVDESAAGVLQELPGSTPEEMQVVVQKAEVVEAKAATSKDKKKEPLVDVPLSRLVAYNKPEWYYAIIGAIGSSIVGAIQPCFAFILSGMISVYYMSNKSKIVPEARKYSWLMGGIAVLSLVGSTAMQYSFGVLGQNLARRLRKQLMTNILRQEVAFFDDPAHSTAALTNKLAEDTTYIRGAVGDTLGLFAQNIMCLAVGYIIAFFFDWQMALVVTGLLPLLVTAMIIYYKFTTGFSSDADKLYTSANQTVTDAFSAIRTIHAYNLQDTICSLYAKLMGPADRTMKRNSHLTGISMGYSNLISFGIYSIIIWFGGEQVSSGRSTFDEMLKAFLAVLMAAIGLSQAQVAFPDIGKAKLAVQRVFPVLDRKSAIDSADPSGSTPSKCEGAVSLRNVTFVYPQRPQITVLKDFSLEIPAGKMVALVGESGSGKSTIVSLLERFYDPIQGALLLDGQDIRSYNLKWLRAQMALVSQEPMLFGSTILENIRYGQPDASLEMVVDAAKAANAHDFIEALPDKYNTQVGDRGMQLSGGQKQRVAIARAVLKNPRILLLDEATSALDATSEKVVQAALDTIMVGRTTIAIAHRLSTIRNANTIAFVYHGSILEQGTHEELMTLPDGGYARLVAAQMARSKSKADLSS